MKRAIKVSVQRKILLLLKEMNRFRDDFEVPETLSQKGIGRELNIRQNHVSRALSELKESGLVESRTTHIKDIGRKRRVYFLTKEGQMENLEYINSIQDRTVPVRSSDGTTRLKSVRKLMKDLFGI